MEKREGPRSGYVGTEVFLSLVDSRELPYRNPVRQLGVQIRCTNRDLPLFMPTGQAGTFARRQARRTACCSVFTL